MNNQAKFIGGPLDGMLYWADASTFATDRRFSHQQKHSVAVYLYLRTASVFRFHHYEPIKQQKAKK